METSITGEPASPHHVGIAIRAVCFSAMLGALAGTLLLWGFRTLQPGHPYLPGQSIPTPLFIPLIGALLGTPGLAALSTWALTRPLISPWRRAGFSALAGGTAILVILASAVADYLGGRAGLLAYAALCAVGCLILSRRVAEGMRAI